MGTGLGGRLPDPGATIAERILGGIPSQVHPGPRCEWRDREGRVAPELVAMFLNSGGTEHKLLQRALDAFTQTGLVADPAGMPPGILNAFRCLAHPER